MSTNTYGDFRKTKKDKLVQEIERILQNNPKIQSNQDVNASVSKLLQDLSTLNKTKYNKTQKQSRQYKKNVYDKLAKKVVDENGNKSLDVNITQIVNGLLSNNEKTRIENFYKFRALGQFNNEGVRINFTQDDSLTKGILKKDYWKKYFNKPEPQNISNPTPSTTAQTQPPPINNSTTSATTSKSNPVKVDPPKIQRTSILDSEPFSIFKENDGTYSLSLNKNKIPKVIDGDVDSIQGLYGALATDQILQRDLNIVKTGSQDIYDSDKFKTNLTGVLQDPSKNTTKLAEKELQRDISKNGTVSINFNQDLEDAFYYKSNQQMGEPFKRSIYKTQKALFDDSVSANNVVIKGLDFERHNFDGIDTFEQLIEELRKNPDANQEAEKGVQQQIKQATQNNSSNTPKGKNVFNGASQNTSTQTTTNTSSTANTQKPKSAISSAMSNSDTKLKPKGEGFFSKNKALIGWGAGLLAAGFVTKELLDRRKERKEQERIYTSSSPKKL